MTPTLSIVIVAYEMTPQLRRTLLSFAPAYQQGMPEDGVEIIVIDNGTTPPPTAADLATPGLTITLHHYPTPTVSPVGAANYGLDLARGDIVGMLIDGARMASPGLVAASLEAVAMDPRAIAATYNHHLGRTAQHYSVAQGYSPEAEKVLLGSIGWPDDGYRLFEIAVPEGEEGFPSPMSETNALFMRRSMWQELGGYDPSFDGPGGGLCNPDLFRRACALPGAVLVKIAGEATFHQVHGGTATNTSDRSVLREMGREYAKIRGRAFTRVRGPALLYDARTRAVSRQDG